MSIKRQEQSTGRWIADIGLVLWPPLGVRLEGVSLGNSAEPGFSQEPMIEIGAFELKVNTWDLIAARTVNVERIIIKNPSILHEIDSDGRTNLDDLTGPTDTSEVVVEAADVDSADGGAAGLPGFINLQEFRIVGGSVRFNDAAGNMTVAAGLGGTVSTGDLMAALDSPNHRRINFPVTGTTDDPSVGTPNVMGVLTRTDGPQKDRRCRCQGHRSGKKKGSRTLGALSYYTEQTPRESEDSG